jgi:hypothetical protein
MQSLSYIGNSRKKQDAQWQSMQLHIRTLRSLEDSDRSRHACVKYLQNWLFFFSPDRPELIAEMAELVRQLGGNLTALSESWKYKAIKDLAGPQVAKRAELLLPRLKLSLRRSWDKALRHLQHPEQRWDAHKNP